MAAVEDELAALIAELRANVEAAYPGFWASSFGQRVDASLTDPARLAEILRAQKWGYATGWRIRGRG